MSINFHKTAFYYLLFIWLKAYLKIVFYINHRLKPVAIKTAEILSRHDWLTRSISSCEYLAIINFKAIVQKALHHQIKQSLIYSIPMRPSVVFIANILRSHFFSWCIPISCFGATKALIHSIGSELVL